MLAIDYPSWVQAFSALAVAILTVVLVLATRKYVKATRDLAAEAARTNDMAAANTERLLRANAPMLEVRDGSRGFDEQAGVWAFSYSVRNHGRSVAHSVRLHTKYGYAVCPEPVPIDQPPNVFTNFLMRLNKADYPNDANDPHPTVIYCSFLDRGGTWWRQVPSALPTLVDGPPPMPDDGSEQG